MFNFKKSMAVVACALALGGAVWADGLDGFITYRRTLNIIVRVHGTSDPVSGVVKIGTLSQSFTASGAEGTLVTVLLTAPAGSGTVEIGNPLVPGSWAGSSSFTIGDVISIPVDVDVTQVAGWGPVRVDRSYSNTPDVVPSYLPPLGTPSPTPK